MQYRHYQSLLDIYLENPEASDGAEEEFSDLIGFVAQMCVCYPEHTKTFPTEISNLLKTNHTALSYELRGKMVQSLCMLRNKGTISSEALIQALFPILTVTESKQLRSQIYSSLISMMKSVNQGAKNQKVNKALQALLFSLLNDQQGSGLWATKITRELWRRGIWDDSRTVEIMCQAAVHPNIKVATSAIRFFLGADKEREDTQAEEDEEEEVDTEGMKHKASVNKKNTRRTRKMESTLKSIRKKNTAHHSATYLNFSAIHLLRDPQGFADQLFSKHLAGGGNRLNLERKILCLNLISRLVGTHKLILLKLYSFLLKYLTPKQRDVTQFMAAAAQASHEHVPPEDIRPVVRKIADEFVSDGVASEVAAAGLNTIREIVARAPHAIDQTLLHDLTEYKGSKAKPVMMAARSLISLFRDIDPGMLKTKDRGKAGTIALKSDGTKHDDKEDGVKYGLDRTAVSGIDGLDLLMKWKAEQGIDENAEADDKAWEVASDSEESDDDDEGWVKVDSDDEIEFSDSEDEKEPDAKKSKLDTDTAVAAASNSDAFMKLAATTVLTPADFAKIEELRVQAGIDQLHGKKKNNEDAIDASALVGNTRYKQTKEERIAVAQEGKEGRDFGSSKGKKLAEKSHSTTNKEKARKKNFMMMIHKRDVQGKARRSLRDKQKSLQVSKKSQRGKMRK